ncbi:TetR/AcrR family transcriptional regulator [Paramicrobacterium fandaimingii]|uniref:TetR/AcrR family transcriptional regulator n=1 Tax=Paramicrobacterium fandaimingii TaxID=2708079 RepID=UPI00141E7C2A|nr:TetR/AcrR family transcriptional regulator [Microbacterium fandaimingii]
MVERVIRTRDAERTQAELLAVATEVFAESGYSGARVDEIAERTRTTKRMIYYYFGGKEGLYLAVLEKAYRGIREAEQTIRVTELDPVSALRQVAELTYDHHLEHSDFMRLVAIENIHRGRYIKQIESLRSVSRPALSLLDDMLQRGRAEGSVRDDVEPLDVHMLISSYCVFQVANQHTFGYLFDLDMLSDEWRDRHRNMLGDIVVSWLTSGVPGAPV